MQSLPARPASPAAEERLFWQRMREASDPQAFAESWLALQCRMIDGVSGGLVLRLSGGAFAPVAHWPAERRPGPHLAAAGERALQERRALALQLDPQDGSGSPHTVIAQPLEVAGELIGAVTLDVTPRPEAELERALRRLSWGTAWLELAELRQSGGGGRDERVDALLDLIATPLEHERFQSAATAFASELATAFGCDRVCVGFVRNADVALCAVSHSARFEKRSNLTRATEAAMDETLEQESVIQWPAPAGAQPRVTRSHAALARQTDAKVVCSVPLAHGPRFCGVVTLERGEPKSFSESEVELLEAAVALAGPTLDVQRRDDRLLVSKVWESTRASLGESLGPRNLALKLGGMAALLLLLFLALAKGDYRVSADAVLEAEVLRAAVAPFDGYVVEAPLRAGDPVAEGTLLAALDDREFALERARYASQLQQLEKQHRQAMAKREASQIRVLSAQIDQVNAQLGLVEEQLAHMRIVAPFEGRIVTGDLSQRLGAPVARGDVLFEVAPLDGFRVALEVDERDIDEIRVGQDGDLVFSASPQDALRFKVEKITPVSAASEGSNTFRVEARLEAPPARLQPGMEGVAKVEVDRRRLLWIWTHEITDWIQLSLWKWTP